MNNRILFMIIGTEVKYLENSNMDHREWYQSLGYDMNNFENIVRGYVIERKIIFFKGMFNYDEEVIRMARVYSPQIRAYCHDSSLEVYCGIVVTSAGTKWEPVLRILENEITGIQPEAIKKKETKKKEAVETGPLLEFKNNYQDDVFRKRAIIVTSIVMVVTVMVKIYLFSQQNSLQMKNTMDIILAFLQVFVLGFTIYGYIKKLPMTKYLGLIASVLLVLSLNIYDVILGILYFMFHIDQRYFIRMINIIRRK